MSRANFSSSTAPLSMENVTDRRHNPFGMNPPCRRACPHGGRAVYGVGDPNADVHVIGDHPGVHGGRTSGIPFGDPPADAVLDLLERIELVDRSSDEIRFSNAFLSHRHCCCLPEGRDPTEREYIELHPYFDAELRAITAHVLVPVGRRTTSFVLDEYSGQGYRTEPRMDDLHATEIAGRGFLIVPLSDPSTWNESDTEAAFEAFRALLSRDYRQQADLGRFIATERGYMVR